MTRKEFINKLTIKTIPKELPRHTVIFSPLEMGCVLIEDYYGSTYPGVKYIASRLLLVHCCHDSARE